MGIAHALSTLAVPRALRQCWPRDIGRSDKSQVRSRPLRLPLEGQGHHIPQTDHLSGSNAETSAAVETSFKDLDTPLLELILSELSSEDLILNARAVCREWHQAAEASVLQRIKSEWLLAHLSGRPRSLRSLLNLKPESFVVRCQVVRGDSITALAIAVNTTVDQLKRQNNLITETSLHARDSVFIPATQIAGRSGEFHYCSVINREFIIIECRDHHLTNMPSLNPGDKPEADAATFSKLALLLSKGLRLNLSTATYYLQSAALDIRTAMNLYQQDNAWDRRRLG